MEKPRPCDPARFPPESAGRIMTCQVPVVTREATIAEVERLLLTRARDFDSLNYIYVVDAGGCLAGVSIKEVFQRGKRLPVAEVMVTDPVRVPPGADQERVVHLALEHDLKAVPVVDGQGLFLGAVLSRTLLTTLFREASEDLLRLGGVRRSAAMFDHVLRLPVVTSLGHRLPWLLLGLVGGMLAAGIIGHFEGTLAKNLILAAFIPLMVYMADAVGTQMEAFIIRDLAVDPELDFLKYFRRQFLIVALIALITSGVLGALSYLLYRAPRISLVLALSLFLGIISSVITGLVIPYLMRRLRQDPANASGPVATILQDLLTVAIFFLIASWLLG
ncbi:MAG: magnesium transporter [Syntrophobacterales bacterium]|nr:magnesium transporter [Syntrophobacterales bacterium]